MAIEKIKILGAEYSFYVKSIATYAPTLLGYNNSVLAIVRIQEHICLLGQTSKLVIFCSNIHLSIGPQQYKVETT